MDKDPHPLLRRAEPPRVVVHSGVRVPPPAQTRSSLQRAEHRSDPDDGSKRPGRDGVAGGGGELVEVAQEGDDQRERESSAISPHRPATATRRRPPSVSRRITTASPQTTTIPVATVRERVRLRSKP